MAEHEVATGGGTAVLRDAGAGHDFIGRDSVQVNVRPDGDRTQVRLALLEMQVMKTQRSQDLLSYAMLAITVILVLVTVATLQMLGGMRQESRDQMAVLRLQMIRVETKIESYSGSYEPWRSP